MSKVTERRDAERMQEQRRLEKANQERQGKSSREFGKLVNQKQENVGQATKRQEMADGKKAAQQTNVRAKLAARQGIQGRTFAQQLHAKADQGLAQKKVSGQTRDNESREQQRVGRDKTSREDGQRLQSESDRVEGLSRDDGGRRGGGGGDLDGRDGGKHSGSQDGQQLGTALGGAAAMQTPEAVATQATAAAQAPQLPAHVLQEIVKRVLVGVNEQGLSEMHIEFNNDVLAGSRLQLSAKDGKIRARFATQDVNVRRLLKASEGELLRAFGRKGLTLEQFEVSEN